MMWYGIVLLLVSSIGYASGMTELNCGRSEPEEYRIEGGVTMDYEEFPWMVSIHIFFHGRYQHFCCGTILNENWIVTTAHCLYSEQDVQMYRVHIGTHKLYGKSTWSRRGHSVSRIVIHSSYDYISLSDNIALVRVKNPFVEAEGYTNGICLLPRNFHEKGWTNVIGWSRTVEKGQKTNTLKAVNVRIQKRKKCKRVYNSRRGSKVDYPTQNQICGRGSDTNEGPCRIDSGSAMVQWGIENTAYLVGILSYGESCDQLSLPIVYTRAASYTDWILNVTILY